MRFLNLCSGTGSVSGPFRENGWEVVEVDWDPTFGPTHCCNLLTWECPYEAGFFDCIWCSPDCRHYSRARTKAKTPRDLEGADALVKRCLELIEQLAPAVWFMENPDSGLLKTRAIVNGLPYVRVDYCMYHAPYRKRTRIWTNTDWTPKLCDRSHLVNGRHVRTAQRGPCVRNNTADRFTRDELHRLPAKLCEEVYSICFQHMRLTSSMAQDPYFSRHCDSLCTSR